MINAALLCIYAIHVQGGSVSIKQKQERNENQRIDQSIPSACSGKDIKRLEVLPGGGWDNLRNIDMGRVTISNYSLCKITEDGQYILPDNAFVIPLKESKVSTFASMYDHWTNYSSTTATTINAEAHGSFFFGSISGSFSKSHRFDYMLLLLDSFYHSFCC